MPHTQNSGNRSTAKEGFTLTEVIMAMTVFGLVIAGVMSVFVGALKSMHGSADAIDVNARSRFVQERLLYDLRAVTEISAITESMSPSEVAKIFSNYTGTEVKNCFRSFTAKINEYNGSGVKDVIYTVVPDGKTPDGKPLKALVREVDGKKQKVLTNLRDGCFTFYKRKSNTGTLEALTSSQSDMANVNAIRFAFLPKDRGPLIPGKDDPSCSAVVQLRYPSYK